jgi:spore maturation protein CgeB
VTYRGAPDLLRLVERYLADPEARAETAARGRACVLARHSFAHRVDELLGIVDSLDGATT